MKTSTKLKAAIFVVGVAFVGFLSYELFYWLTHVYEFDARIKTELTTLLTLYHRQSIQMPGTGTTMKWQAPRQNGNWPICRINLYVRRSLKTVCVRRLT